MSTGKNPSKYVIRKIEVATRKQILAKQKDSAFMRKSLNIYNGQVRRSFDNGMLEEFPYTIAEFRTWLRPFVGAKCPCGTKLTLKQIAVDHNYPISRGGTWTLDNLIARCRSCNWRKGILTPQEWEKLVYLLDTFSPTSRADIFRRLTLGGKWNFGSDRNP